MREQQFDLIILGGGSAGFAAARRGRTHGAAVAMLEEAELGGECPNTACVPTKALLRCAEEVEETWRAGEYGVRTGDPVPDWPAIRDRAAHIVRHSGTDAETEDRLRGEGIAVFRGHAYFLSDRKIRIDGITLAAPRVVITSGSSDHEPPIPGLREAGFITHKEAIDLEALPVSLLIVGAGPVGVEFAQIFAPLGVKVTLVSATPLPLPREDADVSKLLLDALRKRGIEVLTGVRVESVDRCGGEKVAALRREQEKWSVRAEEILLAAGHAPAVESLSLAEAGIAASRRGIQVDEYLRTTAPGIWAAGDCTGIALFTHVATYQGKLAADNAFSDAPRAADHRVIPRATFCRPEIASVGVTERELLAADREYRSASVPIAALEKSIVVGEREGLAKLMTAPDGQILGGHVIGPRAGELIHEVAVAMQHRIPVRGIAGTIHAFPNFAEIWEAVANRLS